MEPGPGGGVPAGLDLESVAGLVHGRVEGDPRIRVTGVAPLADARADQLALLASRRYLADLPRSRGGAVLVSDALAGEIGGRPAVVVKDAHAALAVLLRHFHPPRPAEPGTHPTAVLGKNVTLGDAVRIGPYAVIEEDVQLGDRVQVGAHAVIGHGCHLGDDAVLHPHVVLYPGTTLGRRVIVHAGARLGSDGFGYAVGKDGYRKVPQVGGCVVEDDVEIGANSCVDRGSIGKTVIGRGSKLDNLVHVAHNVHVGPDVAMAALVGIAGSTRIGRGTVFGGQSGAVGHITIGERAALTAQAGATADVAPGETVAGFPARDSRAYMKGMALLLRLPELFKRLSALERRSGVSAAPTTHPEDENG